MKTLTKEEFTIKAIEMLRTEKSKGIHVVYSGFNAAFKQHFGEDPIPVTTAMIKAGKIESYPAKGGPMIYKKGEMPKRDAVAAAQKIVAKILG